MFRGSLARHVTVNKRFMWILSVFEKIAVTVSDFQSRLHWANGLFIRELLEGINYSGIAWGCADIMGLQII